MKTPWIVLYCLLGGLLLTIAHPGGGHFAWQWVAGIVLSAACVPLARFGPRQFLAQFGALFLLLFVVGSVCTVSEAVLFIPGEKEVAARNLAAGFAIYLVASLVLALLARILKLTESSGPAPECRPAGTAAMMIVLSGFAYVVYYLIFGGIVYQFFTRQYYPDAQALAQSLGIRLWLIELARGVLMTLVVVPAIYMLRMRRWPAAIAVGAMLWIVGGGSPLLVPNALMVTAQRYIHIVEIFTQNASLGITAVLLLRRK